MSSANNPRYRYQPKQVDAIVVRAFNFDFPDDLAPKRPPQNKRLTFRVLKIFIWG